MTEARFNLDDYTLRVLDVVKGKYGLKNRNEALNRFVKEFGEEFIKHEIDEKYLNQLDTLVREHEAIYGNRNMSIDELDKLLDLNE